MNTAFALINILSALLAALGAFLCWKWPEPKIMYAAYMVIAAALLEALVIIRTALIYFGS